MGLDRAFRRLSRFSVSIIARWYTFVAVVALIVGWMLLSTSQGWMTAMEAWFFVDAFAASVTLIMVFVLQSDQERDAEALHRKLDELVTDLSEVDSSVAGVEKEI